MKEKKINYNWTKSDTLNEIVNCIEPVVNDNIWDTIHWHLSLKSTRFLNPEIKNMEGDELFEFESKIYKKLIYKLLNELKSKK